MNVVEYNKNIWDKYVEQKIRWTIPVSKDEIDNVKEGIWNIVLTPTKYVPHEWFPEMNNLKILGLASGGGQQVLILSKLGADVTIFDNSKNQLNQDREVCKENNLKIKTEQGDMRDLSRFSNDSFDVIFNPCSLVFVENITSIWKECYRILKPGGVLMTGLINPVIFQLDYDNDPRRIIYPQPYSDLNSLSKEKLEEHMNNNETIEFGHTLTEQIGLQLSAGFLITDFYEDDWNGSKEIDKYLPSFFATRAIKGENK